ncbi:MAG: hypothetical protein MUE95_10145 [Cyclobacteriaceae bacterium]|jgi:hypothetical protein|nr:hypothetical protein [Cyclobacteriaceae bacterium]
MKKYACLLVLLLTLGMLGCENEIQTFTILRQPLVTFQTDTFNTQRTSNAIFFGGATSIHTYPNNTQQSFTRFVLESRGRDNSGRDFILQIEVDVVVNGSYVGVYQPEYQPAVGGLADFRFIIREGNSFIEYGLAPGGDQAYAQVIAQSNEERIVRGIFAATLVNRTDGTAPGIELVNGTFIDIPY